MIQGVHQLEVSKGMMLTDLVTSEGVLSQRRRKVRNEKHEFMSSSESLLFTHAHLPLKGNGRNGASSQVSVVDFVHD